MASRTVFHSYLVFLSIAFGISLLLQIPTIGSTFSSSVSGFYLSLALLICAGYGIHRIAPKTDIPLYVWALLLGIALQVPLVALTYDRGTFLVVIELIASFVLFAGGIHMPVKNFKKYFAPIAALSLIGTILTVLFFALALSTITTLYGFTVPAISLLVLAAVMSSIDPSTIIPILDRLHFRKPFLREIAIAESAVNDVVGIILTRFFLIAALGTGTVSVLSVSDTFSPLLSRVTLGSMGLEILWGILVGFLGAWILKTWGESVGKKHWSDHALFFVVPLFCYALGSLFGAAGFVAAFVAGLLFESNPNTKEVHAYFEHMTNTYIKPIVFILLGVLVPLPMLISTIVVGALAALIFMFLVRPLVVYISLSPWMISKKSLLHWREALFLSFMRETGTIPAILLLYVVASGFADTELIYALGVWIILYTLVIEPPLTALIARRLDIAHT
ncbi:TPA: hypothetical protein DEP58_02675 [Patescibacteria group bacterium]|nr:MAG: Transporter, CPA2 family [Parcubacteria group bacterium GW2011_GWD2_42_14]HCC05187.1 hypothetical protein [Patescibacteria group bacterium]